MHMYFLSVYYVSDFVFFFFCFSSYFEIVLDLKSYKTNTEHAHIFLPSSPNFNNLCSHGINYKDYENQKINTGMVVFIKL